MLSDVETLHKNAAHTGAADLNVWWCLLHLQLCGDELLPPKISHGLRLQQTRNQAQQWPACLPVAIRCLFKYIHYLAACWCPPGVGHAKI